MTELSIGFNKSSNPPFITFAIILGHPHFILTCVPPLIQLWTFLLGIPSASTIPFTGGLVICLTFVVNCRVRSALENVTCQVRLNKTRRLLNLHRVYFPTPEDFRLYRNLINCIVLTDNMQGTRTNPCQPCSEGWAVCLTNRCATSVSILHGVLPYD